MKKRIKTDFRHFDDVRRASPPDLPIVQETAGPVCGAPSVRDLMAAAMAAASMNISDFAGKRPCETDYLAISGAKFPDGIPTEYMVRFNKATANLYDDEASEVRYEAMSAFWHLESFDNRMAHLERRMA